MNKIVLNKEIITLQDLLIDVSSQIDKGVIIVNGDEKDKLYSYSNLYRDARRFSSYLRALGMKPDDELIVTTVNIKEFLICFWGGILSGIIVVPVPYTVEDDSGQRINNIWKKLNNPKIVTTDEMIDFLLSYCDEEISKEIKENNIKFADYLKVDIDDVEYKVSPDKIAFVQFSSGSTGNPKGVILTHKGLIENVKAIISSLGDVITEGLNSLSWLPLTHDMGLIGFHLAPLYCRITHVLMSPICFMRNPNMWLEKICEYKSTVINSPNFGYNYLLKNFDKNLPLDLSSVRVIFNGAEPISYDLCQKFLGVMAEKKLRSNVIFPVYGMAEASLAITFPEVEKEIECVHVDRNHLSIGDKIKVLEDNTSNLAVTFVKLGQGVGSCRYRLKNDKDEILTDNYVGMIEISGENVTSGYYNDEKLTKEFYTDDGWYKTGDVGFEYENNLIVVGRVKDICIINGINYYTNDIENIVAKCIHIDQSRVIAVSTIDYKKNTDYLLVFILYGGDLSGFLKIKKEVEKLIKISFGCDVNILPIKEIPKTVSGKVRRFSLKNQFEKGEFKEVIEELKETLKKVPEEKLEADLLTKTESKLIEIFEREFSGLDISIYDNFTKYGISSLKLTNILNSIKKELPESDFDISLLYKYQTIKDIAEYIDSNDNNQENDSIDDLDLILKNM